MNVYDFDNTIYDGDSSIDFLKFISFKNPLALKGNIGNIILSFLKYKILNKEIEIFKERSFSLIKYLPNIDEYLDEFWEINSNKIKQWYLTIRKNDDVIISASPEFLLKPIISKLNVNLIATIMNDNGTINGVNNKGKEKVIRFNNEYPDGVIDNFYSDSFSDDPLAAIAQKAYLVKGNSITDWPK